MSVLTCRSLEAGYGGVAVVRDLDLALEPGRVLALLGPNGAGKTTVLLTLAGLLPRIGGAIEVFGDVVGRADPWRLSRAGVVLVPDDRSLFTGLTTRENLEVAKRSGSRSITDVMDLFPDLVKRLDVKAGMLSGGEQQMLAMGRALMQNPKVLMVDELSMGLAPVIVERLLPIIRRVADESNTAVVLVEQHVRLALGVADHGMVLVHGEVALGGTAPELLADLPAVERAYLGDTKGEAA